MPNRRLVPDRCRGAGPARSEVLAPEGRRREATDHRDPDDRPRQVGDGQRRRAEEREGAGLVAAELHAVDVLVELLAFEVVAGLGEERDDGGARVAADDGDVLVGGVRVADLGDEARGADDVEGGDTEGALGVVDALALEDLGGDGDGGVDLCSLADIILYRLVSARTGLEMMRMLASGACSAAALARSRTMEALVLNKSVA